MFLHVSILGGKETAKNPFQRNTFLQKEVSKVLLNHKKLVGVAIETKKEKKPIN